MKQNTSANTHPRTNIDAHAHANLEIKLDGWQGSTAVGFICIAAVAIFGLYFKFRL